MTALVWLPSLRSVVDRLTLEETNALSASLNCFAGHPIWEDRETVLQCRWDGCSRVKTFQAMEVQTICRNLGLALERTWAGGHWRKTREHVQRHPRNQARHSRNMVVVGCGSICSPSSPHKLPIFEKASEGWRCGRRTEACFSKFLRFAPGSQRVSPARISPTIQHDIEQHARRQIAMVSLWNPWYFPAFSQGVHAVPTLRPGHRVECR